MNRFFLTDIRRSWRSSVLLLAVLLLSFVGPVLANLLRHSVDSFLRQNARRVLTADLAINAYRPILDDEINRLRKKFEIRKMSRETEFVTMAQGQEKRNALVEVHAVDSQFPIEGEFEFKSASKRANLPLQFTAKTPAPGHIWLSSDALVALRVQVGDSIRLGRSSFIVESEFQVAPGLSRAAFGFAPRGYIALVEAEKTGLLGYGSQVNHRVYLEFERVPSADEVTAALADPDLFLRTPDDSVQGLERFTAAISLYLAIVAIALFALGWIAAFYIVRLQAIERGQNAMIAMIFGASARQLVWFEVARTVLFTLSAAILAFGLAFGLALIVEPFVGEVIRKNVVGGSFRIQASPFDFFGLLLIVLVSAIVYSLPFAARFQQIRIRPLSLKILMASLAALVLLTVSIWLTYGKDQSVAKGFQLAGGFLVAVGLIYFTGSLIFNGFARFGKQLGSLLKIASIQLSRARFAVRLSFLTIGLSAFVVSGIGQIIFSLSKELVSDSAEKSTPDFFVFNIPDSELSRLKAALQSEFGESRSQLEFVSPMILARFKTKNGEAIKNERFEKFPVRITWREKPIASESIENGEPLPLQFDAGKQKLPFISVESRFADQNQLALGDVLEFDVQGVPVMGVIRNFRRVSWTDFNPNFFISFQAGVLEDAPKTWVANIRLQDKEKRLQFQSALVQGFPDMSIIDVSSTLQRALGLIRAILEPAQLAAGVSALFSLLIVAVVVAHSAHQRVQEMNLLRILGTEPRRVRALYRLEFALAAGVGSFAGSALGICFAAFVSIRFLNLPFAPDWTLGAIVGLVGGVLGVGIGDWLYRRVALGLGFTGRVV